MISIQLLLYQSKSNDIKAMILLISILVALALLAGYGGYCRIVRIDHLNQRRVMNTLLAALVLLTLMSIAHWISVLPQRTAADIMMGLFSIATGFFVGYAIRLFRLRSKAGPLEYMYRSFWTDVAPNIIAVALFVFGVYRLGFTRWPYLTGIGITSGLSLMAFALLGWTIRIVPEFRTEGILLLDQYIEWKKVVSYQWADEHTLQVDYLTKNKTISEFKTYIPSEDQLIIERLLGKKLKEYEEARKQITMATETDQSLNSR